MIKLKMSEISFIVLGNMEQSVPPAITPLLDVNIPQHNHKIVQIVKKFEEELACKDKFVKKLLERYEVEQDEQGNSKYKNDEDMEKVNKEFAEYMQTEVEVFGVYKLKASVVDQFLTARQQLNLAAIIEDDYPAEDGKKEEPAAEATDEPNVYPIDKNVKKPAKKGK